MGINLEWDVKKKKTQPMAVIIRCLFTFGSIVYYCITCLAVALIAEYYINIQYVHHVLNESSC